MIKMTGYVEIDKVIKGLSYLLNHNLLQSIHERAMKETYLKAAYFAAPLLSGRTAESLGVVKPSFQRSGSIGLVYGGPRRGRFGGHVAHLSEFGTKRRTTKSGANRGVMPRRPFLEPSWERTSGQAEQAIREATGVVVYRFMRRTVKQYG